jgi:hypothetical protein
LEDLKRFVATFSQKLAVTMFRNSVPLSLGRAEKVIGNLLANIAVAMFRNSVHAALGLWQPSRKYRCYHVQEQCSRCPWFVATFSQISLLPCSGTVFTLPLGRAEMVCGNLLAKIGS